MAPARRLAGLSAAAAIAGALWLAWSGYARFADIAGWTGVAGLGWLRPWLTEFRTPLFCIAGFLALSGLSRIWAKLKLGH